jgi:D-tyrosyl-tRNA(Tyr) deacylase
MRSVVQRVSRATVTVDEREVARIGPGLVVFVGIAKGDGPADITYTTSKVSELRVFPDAAGRMNRSVAEAGGSILVVSQFTLLGDARQGRRPAFDAAEAPDPARATYDALIRRFKEGSVPIATGEFQAHMSVDLINDGPVTILLDSRRLF